MKCLIIDPTHDSILPLLKSIGVEPDYRPDIKPEEVLQIIGNYEGLLVRSKMTIDNAMMDRGKKLRFIARAGAGVDQIDEKYLKARGLTLINAPEGNRDAVGEHTVGMILCLLNKMHTADREVRQKKWLREENRGYEIMGKTVGIVGYGNMGRATAIRLSGFGCRVITYDKRREHYGDEYAKRVTLDELYEQTDILCLHIPLDEDNRGLVDDVYVNNFKKNFYMVNMARGEVLPLATIHKGLESGKIIAAALDVLENEKLNTLTPQQLVHFDYLAASDRVLFTPHVGGWTHESYRRINEVITEKIKKLLQSNTGK